MNEIKIEETDVVIYKRELERFQTSMMKKTFPDEGAGLDVVDFMMKRMFMNRLVLESFNAGWVAAGKVVPESAK